MQMAKSNSVLSSNAYNESGPGTGDEAMWPVDEAYTDYEQCMKMQNSQMGGDMVSTPNTRSGEGIMGGVAPGEPDAVGMSKLAESKSRKKR